MRWPSAKREDSSDVRSNELLGGIFLLEDLLGDTMHVLVKR